MSVLLEIEYIIDLNEESKIESFSELNHKFQVACSWREVR